MILPLKSRKKRFSENKINIFRELAHVKSQTILIFQHILKKSTERSKCITECSSNSRQLWLIGHVSEYLIPVKHSIQQNIIQI